MVTRYLWKDCLVGDDVDVDVLRYFLTPMFLFGKRKIMLEVATEASLRRNA